jgi:hypothetical protein
VTRRKNRAGAENISHFLLAFPPKRGSVQCVRRSRACSLKVRGGTRPAPPPAVFTLQVAPCRKLPWQGSRAHSGHPALGSDTSSQGRGGGASEAAQPEAPCV